MKFSIVLLATTALWCTGEVHGLETACPNSCSGHGVCNLGECQCFAGYKGGDCSLRVCPFGKAWNDQATDVDEAHNLAECSNRGSCDRVTGQCVCDPLFTGNSCQYSKCPNDCWGRGRCVNMMDYAKMKDPGLGIVHVYEDVWDAEMMYGCICDQGFTGYDCSLKECPIGDDPLTTSDVDEVQLLQCKASNGFFTLSFRGFTTEPIPATTYLTEFIQILENTPGFGDVDVTFSEVGSQVCSSGVDQIASITFLQNFGSLERLYSQSTHSPTCDGSTDLCGGTGLSFAAKGDALAATTGGVLFSVEGTKENEPCSNRGRCDSTTGICSCYTRFVTSDGRGGEGDRGDCGYASAEIQSCPGLISCSGHGVCSQAPEYKCTCSAGWGSGDCSVRTCPVGRSFFDLPISNNRAHQLALCSDRGVCDEATGLCRCFVGYEGAACDKLSCPGSPLPCSGNGQCLSMSQLAELATENGEATPTTYGNTPNNPLTWDYDMIYGCLCDPGYEGYDCSLRSCPHGDNPDTGWELADLQYNEVQAIRCTGDGGNIRLYFRREFTSLISYNADEATVRAALSALSSIGDVTITFSAGGTLCTADGSNVVTVEFTQDFGDLPAIIGFYNSEGAALTHSTLTPNLEFATDGSTLGGVNTYRGTKENLECNGKGTCSHEFGTCNCFTGYGSSDGNGNAGHRGDCGYRIPWATGLEDA